MCVRSGNKSDMVYLQNRAIRLSNNPARCLDDIVFSVTNNLTNNQLIQLLKIDLCNLSFTKLHLGCSIMFSQ